MAYQSWSVVFSEQPSAAKWNILGTNDAHFYTFLGDNTAWQAWAPSWTNLTVGNGTLNYADYIQIGKTVHLRLKFTLGNTSSVSGNIVFSLPVGINGDYTTNKEVIQGTVGMVDDTDDAIRTGQLKWVSSSTVAIEAILANGTYASADATSGTKPFIWATADVISVAATYEGI